MIGPLCLIWVRSFAVVVIVGYERHWATPVSGKVDMKRFRPSRVQEAALWATAMFVFLAAAYPATKVLVWNNDSETWVRTKPRAAIMNQAEQHPWIREIGARRLIVNLYDQWTDEERRGYSRYRWDLKAVPDLQRMATEICIVLLIGAALTVAMRPRPRS